MLNLLKLSEHAKNHKNDINNYIKSKKFDKRIETQILDMVNNENFNFILQYFNEDEFINQCITENPDNYYNEISRYHTILKINVNNRTLYFSVVFALISEKSGYFEIITMFPDRTGDNKKYIEINGNDICKFL